MDLLSRHGLRQILTSLLVVVCLGSQIFSCCLVNQKLGSYLKSLFEPATLVMDASHACCPKKANSEKETEKPASGTEQHKGCCVQDANQRLPQIPSEQISAPEMPNMMVALLPDFVPELAQIPVLPELGSSSSPPVYLTQLRLLI